MVFFYCIYCVSIAYFIVPLSILEQTSRKKLQEIYLQFTPDSVYHNVFNFSTIKILHLFGQRTILQKWHKIRPWSCKIQLVNQCNFERQTENWINYGNKLYFCIHVSSIQCSCFWSLLERTINMFKSYLEKTILLNKVLQSYSVQ